MCCSETSLSCLTYRASQKSDGGVGRRWNIHRADYQNVLAKAAEKYGAKLIFSADVVNVDVDTATVRLSDGREMNADVIVGADGTSYQFIIPWSAC